MRALLKWTDLVPPPRELTSSDGQKSSRLHNSGSSSATTIAINDLSFNPSGTLLAVAVGDRILLYDAQWGDLVKSLRGHSGIVYSLDWSKDGSRFVTGGADRQVILWTSKGEGVLKYSHNDPVYKVAYNPVSHQVASGSLHELWIYSPDAVGTGISSKVNKQKLPSKVLSLSWSSDGSYVAVGMESGLISIRDGKSGGEKLSINRPGQPIWSLTWCFSKDDVFDTLAVGSWSTTNSSNNQSNRGINNIFSNLNNSEANQNSGTLSFYTLSGIQQYKERKLGCNPLTIKSIYPPQTDMLLVAGSNGEISLCTKEGVRLVTLMNTTKLTKENLCPQSSDDNDPNNVNGSQNNIHERHDVERLNNTPDGEKQIELLENNPTNWPWCASINIHQNLFAVGTASGDIFVYQTVTKQISTVYKDRYAIRDSMTDVVAQHFLTEQKVRIKCRDYVHHVAIYKDRLAVQLPERVHVYQLTNTNTSLAESLFGNNKKHNSAANSLASQQGGIMNSNRLAMFLNGYTETNDFNMHYHTKDKVNKVPVGLHLGVLSNHLIITLPDGVMTLYNFKGIREKEWRFSYEISYLKIDGGIPYSECVLVGLADGSIHRVIINSVFSIPVVTLPNVVLNNGQNDNTTIVSSPIKIIEISATRKKLGVVNEHGYLYIYDIFNNMEIVYQDTKIKEFCFNVELEDLFSFTKMGEEELIYVRGASDTLNTSDSNTLPDNHNTNSNSRISLNSLSVANADSTMSKMVSFPKQQVKTPEASILLSFRSAKLFTTRGLLLSNNVVKTEKEQKAIISASTKSSGTGTNKTILLTPIDVPLGPPIAKYLELDNYRDAYNVAALGIPNAEWKRLGMTAMRTLHLEVAKQIFIRLKDVRALDFIHSLMVSRDLLASSSLSTPINHKEGGVSNLTFASSKGLDDKKKQILLAEISIFLGHFKEAAKLFARCGKVNKAMQIFINLKNWEEAKVFAATSKNISDFSNDTNNMDGETVDLSSLLKKQAEWAEQTGAWQTAAEMYIKSKDKDKALEVLTKYIYGENKSKKNRKLATTNFNVKDGVGEEVNKLLTSKNAVTWRSFFNDLISESNKGNPDDRVFLLSCGDSLIKEAPLEVELIHNTYSKLEDYSKLMSFYISRQNWEGAVRLSEEYPTSYDARIFLPYADWLITNDRFDEAIYAYRKAGRPDKAEELLLELTNNAMFEGRFQDASRYYFLAAKEGLQILAIDAKKRLTTHQLCSENGASRLNQDKLLRRQSSHDDNFASKQSSELLQFVSESEIENALEEYKEKMQLADVLYAYQYIWSYTKEPFTKMTASSLFQAARYILNVVGTNPEADLASMSRTTSSYTGMSHNGAAGVAGMVNSSESGTSNVAKQNITEIVYKRISRVDTLYTLAQASQSVGALKLARQCLQKLQKMVIPGKWESQIDSSFLFLQSKAVSDDNETIPVCYRCGCSNPLLNPFSSNGKYKTMSKQQQKNDRLSQSKQNRGFYDVEDNISSKLSSPLGLYGDVCTSCGHPFIRSYTSFEILPLVEFVPDASITLDEALDMIRTPPLNKGNDGADRTLSSSSDDSRLGTNSRWKENIVDPNIQSLSLDDESNENGLLSDDNMKNVMGGNELFNQCINTALERQQSSQSGYSPVTVNAKTLLNLDRREIFLVETKVLNPSSASSKGRDGNGGEKLDENKEGTTIHYRFYRNMLYPDIPIALSPVSGKFFYEEELEAATLTLNGKCPYSKQLITAPSGPL